MVRHRERWACVLAQECQDVIHQTWWQASLKVQILDLEADAEINVDDLPVLIWTVCTE